MNKLPSPVDFKDHKASFTVARYQRERPSYDVAALHKEFFDEKQKLDHHFSTVPPSVNDPENPITLLYNLIDKSLVSLSGIRAWKPYLGYSCKDKSLTISLLDDSGKVHAVAIRESRGIKWRTYGSKTFIPYRIEDDFIFLFSGMAEVMLMDVFGLSYIQLQADGMIRHLPEELKSHCAGKTIIVLQDNDPSFKQIVPEIKSFFDRSDVLVIDFELMLNRPLQHGYDFRDLCNEIKDPEKILQLVEDEIIFLQEKSYV